MARPITGREKPVSIRLGKLQQSCKDAAEKMNVSDAEALRLAAEVGFYFLRMVNYDIGKCVVDSASEPPRQKTRKSAQVLKR